MEDVLSAFGFRAVGYRDLIKDLQSEKKYPLPPLPSATDHYFPFLV
jgi:hypothetical protein